MEVQDFLRDKHILGFKEGMLVISTAWPESYVTEIGILIGKRFKAIDYIEHLYLGQIRHAHTTYYEWQVYNSTTAKFEYWKENSIKCYKDLNNENISNIRKNRL